VFGKDLPGKEARVSAVRSWVHARSPYALAAGALGVFAPVDGILILPALASIGMGIFGWRHLDRRPDLRGRRLCLLGVVGGMIGLSFATYLYVLKDRPAPAEADGEPTALVEPAAPGDEG